MYNIKNSKELASVINYTNLNNIISEGEMKEFLEKAKELNFNSVIIPPTYVSLAKEILNNSDIKIGSVVGFPLGFEDTEGKLAETKALINKGVSEIEVVVNLSHLKDGKHKAIKNELKQLKELVGDKTLKLNIETKALTDPEKATIAKLAEESNVDYIKTSTGFVTPNHIYENVNDINIIQRHAPKIKIEIFGSIDNYKLANQVLTAGADMISSNQGYEIVTRYKDLRENTKITPKPIRLKKND